MLVFEPRLTLYDKVFLGLLRLKRARLFLLRGVEERRYLIENLLAKRCGLLFGLFITLIAWPNRQGSAIYRALHAVSIHMYIPRTRTVPCARYPMAHIRDAHAVRARRRETSVSLLL